jgi:DNA-directed RNA polymerase specialized sigma24 family protein
VPVADVAGVHDPPDAAAGAALDVTDPGDPLWAAVRALPERQRTAVALRYVADLDHPQVARALGTTPAASRRLVSDALATLRLATPPTDTEPTDREPSHD